MAGTLRKATERSALRCRNAKTFSRHKPDKAQHDGERHHSRRRRGRIALLALDRAQYRDRLRDGAPSPYSKAEPTRPTINICARQVPRSALRAESNARRTTMPPPPRLSARKISSAYLSETSRMNAHKIKDTVPKIAPCVSSRQWAALAASLSA